MNLYCTGCEEEIEARLTNGKERYPHRPDLYELHNKILKPQEVSKEGKV